jgi:hypothetical protein
MDPITAWALAVRAGAEFGTEIVRGMTPEQKHRVGDMFLDDLEKIRKDWTAAEAFARKLLKLD